MFIVWMVTCVYLTNNDNNKDRPDIQKFNLKIIVLSYINNNICMYNKKN